MALSIFPEEVWELILDKLLDSKDILTIFQTYPELEVAGVLKSTRQNWLFEKVIALLPIYKKDILSCRLVSKRWCRGVDNFLENHPYKRAFSHGKVITGQIYTSRASPNYRSLSYVFRNPEPFKKIEIFDNFTKIFESHLLSKRNPFIGRSVEIQIKKAGGNIQLENEGRPSPFWNKALHFLRQFGEHIWFLKIDSNHPGFGGLNTLQYIKFLMLSLRLVPNLKSLTINILENTVEDDEEAQEFFQRQKQPLPELPQLETLIFEEIDCLDWLADGLISAYSKQIRRMELQRNSEWFLEPKYSKMFPNLTELYLEGIPSWKELSNLLTTLNSPNLWRLRVHGRMELNVTENRIGKLLTRFPKINTLIIKSNLWYDREFRNSQVNNFPRDEEQTISIPSLKTLVLFRRDYELEPYVNLLKCFPALEYLKIYTPSDRQPGNVYKFDRNVYNSEFWTILPKLKWLSLSITGNVYYSRVDFEKLQEQDI